MQRRLLLYHECSASMRRKQNAIGGTMRQNGHMESNCRSYALPFAGIMSYQGPPPMLRRNARPATEAWVLRRLQTEMEGFYGLPLNPVLKLVSILEL